MNKPSKDLYASTTVGVEMNGDRKIPAPPKGLIVAQRKRFTDAVVDGDTLFQVP